MRRFHRILLVVLLLVTVVGLLRQAAVEAPEVATVRPGIAAREERVQSAEDAKGLEDPRVLLRAGDFHRDAGRLELARTLYEQAVDSEELALYFKYGKRIREALVLEHLQQWDAAEALYRENAENDIHYTVIALRVASAHPRRDSLVAELIERVRQMAAQVRAGESVVFYVTSKGDRRYLEHVPDDEVLPRLQAYAAGKEDQRLRYCYIDRVDLSAVPSSELPERIQFSQCIIGSVRIADRDVGRVSFSGFILGDFDVGKTWDGEVNKSTTIPASRFAELTTRDTVFLGKANFQDVRVDGRKSAFPLSVFEGPADFRGFVSAGWADFRFSVFAEGARFRGARFAKTLYFGGARFRKDTSFTGLFAERDIYFDSVRFEAPVRFDACEWRRKATFENATFAADVSFSTSQIAGRVNLSRAVFEGVLEMREVQLGGLDLFGARLLGDARFSDATFDGKVRFSLDDATRTRYFSEPELLLGLYRDYQGDDDTQEPLAERLSYGVEHVDDLIAEVRGNLSFANSVFNGFCIFENVTFGQPGHPTVADFFNTQFGGETHFERTTWWADADFSTIYAEELALNEAVFHRTLLLDDANIPGRVTLTDARFEGDATISFYGAEIRSFQIDRSQVEDLERGRHRLWYERCALSGAPADDLRIQRHFRGAPPDAAARAGYADACLDRAIDEFVTLKAAFGDQALADDEDWAFWWIKHHQSRAALASWAGVLTWPIRYLIFELAFGWGVRLGNLAVTSLVVCVVFTFLYRYLCPDTELQYDGRDTPIREISWWGLFIVSLQSFGGFNTGWDMAGKAGLGRQLMTLELFIGVIVLTFFVGAYTRMILA